jgi:hypothetical protein
MTYEEFASEISEDKLQIVVEPEEGATESDRTYKLADQRTIFTTAITSEGSP